jgi:uncharacterized protein (TIGR02996 family)
MNEGQALFACVQENLADLAPRLIYSDWLEEQGRLQEALSWRQHKTKTSDFYDLYYYGSGEGWDFCHFGHGDYYCYGNGFRWNYENPILGNVAINLTNNMKERTSWLKQHEFMMNKD